MTNVQLEQTIALEGAEQWRDQLRAHGHYIELREAFDIWTWHRLRRGPLILQGEPGCGKTSLLERIAAIIAAKVYWIQCYESVDAGTVLYRITNEGEIVLGKLSLALLDEAETVLVALDEVDKVEERSELNAAILEFTGKQQITINEAQETREVIRRSVNLPRLLIGMTSNAAPGELRETLTKPLLRRGKLIQLQHPKAERMIEILASEVPRLDAGLCRDVAMFVEALRRDSWDKPVSLAEAIDWACTLAEAGCTELTEEIVEWTSGDLAKGRQELEALRLATRRLIKHVRAQRQLRVA